MPRIHICTQNVTWIKTLVNKFIQKKQFFFDPALLNHAEMLRCANILVRHKKDGPVRPVLLIC